MPTLTYLDTGLALNPSVDDVLDPGGTISERTATDFEIINNSGPWSGYRFHITGTDFTYLAGQPLTGTIQGFSILRTDGQVVAQTDSLANPDLGEFWDRLQQGGFGELQALEYLGAGHIVGSAGADHIHKSGGGQIEAGAGNDVIDLFSTGGIVVDAGAGDDRIIVSGYAGPGSYFGGTGFDTLEIGVWPARVQILSSIEAVAFSGSGNLSLYPTAGVTEALHVSSAVGAINTILISGLQGSTVDLSGWTFGRWDAASTIQISGDFIVGSSKADLIVGSSTTAVTASGGDGNDRFIYIYSTADDTFNGDTGDDYFLTGFGTDRVDGGSGSDTVDYSFLKTSNGTVANLHVELDGANWVAVSGTDHQIRNVENVIGGDGRDYLVGDQFDNSFDGGRANDVLQGGAGHDVLDGGAGIDFGDYSDRTAGVSITLNGATNAVVSVGGVAEDTIRNIENLIGGSGNDALTGDILVNAFDGGGGNDTLAGDAGADVLSGGDGNDSLNGGTGIDTLTGGTGNDIYYVDVAGDKVNEVAGQGTADWVATTVSYVLAAGADIETFSTTLLAGTAAINLMGNSAGQTIYGNAGANLLSGKAGNDTLIGGGGADAFVFDTALNVTTNVDRITDFNVPADTIWLENNVFAAIVGTGALTSGQFAANATGTAQDGSDRIVYETDTGKLFYDANGSNAGGSAHFATLAANLALTGWDFHIV